MRIASTSASADVSPRSARTLVEGEERENFRAALEWAQQAAEIETVARLAAPLSVAWIWQGRLSEADRWLACRTRTINRVPPAGSGTGADCGARAGVRARRPQGERPNFATRRSRSIASSATQEGRCWKRRSELPRREPRRSPVGRAALLEEALAIESEHDLTHAHAHTLVHVAGSYVAEGRLDRARGVLEEALLATEAGSGARVLVQVNLAHIANVERRHTDAGELAQEVLEPAFAIGHSHHARSRRWSSLGPSPSSTSPNEPHGSWARRSSFTGTRARSCSPTKWRSEQAIRYALGAQLDPRARFHALLDEGRGVTVEQAVREEWQQTKLRA